MPDDTLVESNTEQQIQQPENSSSGDVRSAIQDAMKEVSDRQRDQQGRFAKGEQAAPTEKPAEGTAQQVAKPAGDAQQPNGTATTTTTEQAPAIKPPDSWSPAAKAKFAAMDPELQQEVMRREAEVHKGFTTQDEHRKLGKTFTDVMTPYLPMIRAEGGDPIAAVQNLMQTAYNLRAASQDQKQEMCIALCQQYGIDLRGVFNRLSGGQRQVDPQVSQLQQQLQALQQDKLQREQSQQSQEQAQIHQTIDSFASDPKNVYFVNVKAEMAALLHSGQAKDLQGAYDMACWARPDIRPLMLQQNEQQKQAAARDKAQKARQAGVSISGSPNGSAGIVAPENRSLRDEIRANLREVAANQ